MRYKLILFIGISLPYIIQFYSVGYHRFLFSLFSIIFSSNVYSFSVLMSIAAIFAIVYRLSRGPGSLQDSLIITTLTTPVVFPSLIMLFLLIFSIGEMPSQYLGSASNLYLVGIAAMLIVSPLLGVILHWFAMIKAQGSPIGHILYTMIILSLVNFVFFSSVSVDNINEQLIGHGTNIILNGIFIIKTIISNILQSEMPTVPSNLGNFQPNVNLIYSNTIFGISAALYLYFRLFKDHTLNKLNIDGFETKTFLNIDNIGKISITLILAILLNFVLILGFSTVFQSINLILKASILMLMSTFVITIIFYSYQGRD